MTDKRFVQLHHGQAVACMEQRLMWALCVLMVHNPDGQRSSDLDTGYRSLSVWQLGPEITCMQPAIESSGLLLVPEAL